MENGRIDQAEARDARLRGMGSHLMAAALLMGLLSGGEARADPPLLIGYQGAVFDDVGAPAEGPVEIEVALFESDTGGNAVYSENHAGVSLVDGTFDLQIGAGGSAVGTFDEGTFAARQVWLELEIDGETMSPRQRLVSVPYALRAAVAERLDGAVGAVPYADQAGHAQSADRLTAQPTAGNPSQLLAVHVDPSGTTTGDGARVFFDQTWVDGVNHDALVFEKVDRGGNDPDGSIVFSNRGADGVSEMSMQIDGQGNVGIPAVEASGNFTVYTDGRRAANLWTTHDDMAVYAWNGGTGEAIVAQSSSSTYHRATVRAQNFNATDGVAGYFRNHSPEATVSLYNFGTGPGLIVRGTGSTDVMSAWTRPSGSSSSTKEFWVGGDGVTNVRTLRIHGGADLSERFDVGSSGGESIAPGTVVAIDPNDPGKLVVSGGAYDRTVAGIVAGAGGIAPGMLMHQEGSSVADGDHPVALTGRVYARADTSNGPIRPGDLLTTAERPGHAMKATDWQRSMGAVIGKAMSALDEETGLVLVLVGLQ